MKILITKQHLDEFRPISGFIDIDRINPYIQEAQSFDLKQLLGPALFVDFMAKYDNDGLGAIYTAYQNLLKGSTYTVSGRTYEHPGLIGFLVYCTLARFYNGQQTNVTRYGLVGLQGEGMTPLDARAVAAEVAQLKANALSFAEEIRDFLAANASTYPLYSSVNDMTIGGNGAMFFDLNDNPTPGVNTNNRTIENL